MYFLNPTYLWALLGLAVPIAIHLWSRKEGRVVRIGSIQMLRESDSKQTSNIKLNEFWLLLLRLLIITILVFILAAPHLKNEGENTAITYLIEPSLIQFDEVTTLLDTLEPGSVKLLQPGFPLYVKEENNPGIEATPNYWQLASEIGSLQTDSVVVFTRAYQSGIKGKRPQLSQNINWLIIDVEDAAEGFVSARKKGEDVELVKATGSSQNLRFDKERVPENSNRIAATAEGDSISFDQNSERFPLQSEDSLHVVIFFEDALENEMRYIRSSFRAISKFIETPIAVTTTREASFKSENARVLVWLSETTAIETNASMLLYRPDSLANDIITSAPSKNQFYLTRRLNAENILSAYLPENLLPMLDLHQGTKEKIQKYDRRVVDREELQPVFAGGGTHKSFTESRDLSSYLWILLLVLLLAERALARYRVQ